MRHIVCLLAFFSFTLSLFAQEERPYIRDGNDLYTKAKRDTKNVDTLKYKKAAEAYRAALEKKPDSYEATYNLGNAYYRQNNFKDAETQFKIAANKNQSKKLNAQTYHNLGNSLLQTGKLEESIEAYKNALKNNPTDKETKYNLAYAQHMLKKQQQQNKNDKNQDNKDQKDKDKQDKDKQNKDEKNKDQQNKDQQSQDKQNQEQKQEQKQGQKKDQISKQDAQRILEAMQNDEKKVQEKLQKEKVKANRVRISRDW